MCSQMGSCELDKKVSEWLTWDKNETTCEKLRSLVAEKNTEELSKILLKRISFGTAGLRGKMAVGYSCMNDLVIIQTAQGFLKYLEQVNVDLLKKNGIAVGYDGRHNSRRWAELTAAIFLHAGYPVRLFSQVNPTPFIPFAVTKYKCASGVMVTASHNPKEDNGYKVYGSNGAQIVSPADKDIQKFILQNLQPLETSWDTSILTNNNLLSDPLPEVLETYLQLIDLGILLVHKEINIDTKLLFTYTAMHGVGYQYVQKVCDVIGIKIVPVVEQKDPHPDFPTVKFPNPEEGKSSLDLSFKTAEENNSRVIIANDPDADRMAAAEKSPKTGDWKVFSGNELGALFGWWMLNCFQIQYPNEPLSNVCMISSTVSSMILKTMSKAEGFNFFDTLTGFKWIVSGFCQVTLPNQPIKDALFLHNFVNSNLTLKDCSFRPTNAKDMCPDPDIRYVLYSNGKKEVVDYTQSDWLRQSNWDPTKEDIFLIHGYAGGDDLMPMVVLRDAYLNNGSYNVWVVDWGNLAPPPCYRAAVNNMKAVAKCTGDLITSLRIAGLQTERLTCVGHSLGAHVCGLIARSVIFRLHRIIALDPARPLVSPNSRLTSGDAGAVHVLHTNAGHYGEAGRAGHVDFCINGGRIQPYCENEDIDAQLCSHVWAVCYMAESLYPHLYKKAEPCSRRCPSGPRPGNRVGLPVIMGQSTPLTASGSYCVQDKHPPFCPKHQGAIGDNRCCLKSPEIIPPSTETPVESTTLDIFS